MAIEFALNLFGSHVHGLSFTVHPHLPLSSSLASGVPTLERRISRLHSIYLNSPYILVTKVWKLSLNE